MRLIDVDKLKMSLNEKRDVAITRNANSFGEIEYFSSLATLIAVTDCISSVNEQPTVDAVPVVRCMDCKHYLRNKIYVIEGIPLMGNQVCEKWGDGCRTDENGFCFMGERREE